jgi:putative transposase
VAPDQKSFPWAPGATGDLLARVFLLTIVRMQLAPYRKRVQHFNEPGHCHELTFSCFRRLPLLTHEPLCRLLSQSLDRAVDQQGFWLLAFVYMPDHVHLLVFPTRPTARIEHLLYAIKRPFSYRAKQYVQHEDRPLFAQLTVQERPGKRVFRFWQEGPGYDRNLISSDAVLPVIEYIHNNPVRRGLSLTPAQWKWSSWKAYHQVRADAGPDLPRVRNVAEIL